MPNPLSRARSALASWALCASFPSVALAPRGRFARARLVVCGSAFGPVRLLGPVVVAPVPLSRWCGPVGLWLCGLAFRSV